MNVSLMPHQTQAIKRLEESSGCQLLAMVPGAGKTLTTLVYLADTKNVLFVVPATLLGVWEQEAEKWGFGVPARIAGTPVARAKVLDLAIKEGGRYVIGYEMFLKEHKKLMKARWDALVCDESHKLKSPTAKVSKALRGFSRSIPRRILLSGTPLINGYQDMWNQVDIIQKGVMLENFYAFRNAYAIMPIPNVPAITGWRQPEKILEMMKPYVFTVDKTQIQQNLPDITFTDVPVDLSADERRVYNKIKDELILEIDGEDTSVASALVAVGRLRQCANGLVHFGARSSSKCAALKELLSALGDEPVLIFSMYAQTVDFVASELGLKYKITGETSNRDGIIASWRTHGGPLIGTSSMSTGLNLQEARYVIQIEQPWTKAEEDQRVARAWRTGQKRPVTVYNLMATKTIDEGVKKLILKKSRLAQEMSNYTMQDIKELL